MPDDVRTQEEILRIFEAYRNYCGNETSAAFLALAHVIRSLESSAQTVDVRSQGVHPKTAPPNPPPFNDLFKKEP